MCPVDYYWGNPEALLAERKRKLREGAARRKEVNKWGNLTRIEVMVYISAPSICPKTTEPIQGAVLPSLFKASKK